MCHAEQHVIIGLIVLCLSAAFNAEMRAKPKPCYTQAQSDNLQMGSKHFATGRCESPQLCDPTLLVSAAFVAKSKVIPKACYTQAQSNNLQWTPQMLQHLDITLAIVL